SAPIAAHAVEVSTVLTLLDSSVTGVSMRSVDETSRRLTAIRAYGQLPNIWVSGLSQSCGFFHFFSLSVFLCFTSLRTVLKVVLVTGCGPAPVNSVASHHSSKPCLAGDHGALDGSVSRAMDPGCPVLDHRLNHLVMGIGVVSPTKPPGDGYWGWITD
ncbi:hypothetical protein RRG08_012616, partial [Elysia crispata]